MLKFLTAWNPSSQTSETNAHSKNYVVATFTPRRSDISGARFTRSPLLASRLPAGCRSALWYTNGSHT